MESAFVHVACEGLVFTISPELIGGIKVKRDMEVVRKVLRAIQQKNDLTPCILSVDGVDDLTAGYHIEMLHSAGYIDGPSALTTSVPYRQVLVRGLTWKGHDLAGALLTDDSTWDKVKSALGPEKLVTMPLKVIQDIATKALTAWASSKMGL